MSAPTPDEIMNAMSRLTRTLQDPAVSVEEWIAAAEESAQIIPLAAELTARLDDVAAAVARSAADFQGPGDDD